MSPKHKQQNGFTIVELLIVIVVIGILAAITIVAYNGVQGKARDSQRLSDMNTIVKALEIYKTNTGSYPARISTPNADGWEVSTNGTTATNFLSVLVTSNVISKVPVDPVNKVSGASLNPGFNLNMNEYFYSYYPAGNKGCDTARGGYYVLGVTRMDTVPSGTSSPKSPGWSCPEQDWKMFGAYVTGAFTN